MNPNTKWLMGWCDRMVAKFGHPKDDFDWCRKLAYYVGEAGNYDPSDNAIEVAKTWEFIDWNAQPEDALDKDKRSSRYISKRRLK